MDVRGYPTGPIDAKGAFTSEIDLAPIIKPGPLNIVAEADRPHIVDQPGMRHKYLPLRHDPATGAISSGGRYLFRGYEDATKFRDFLEAKVFPGEQTTFWKRPFFFNAVRFAWRVTGAHDLTPITTHDLNRFERYSVPDAKFEACLPELFPAFLEAARRLDLAHVSLMFQPEHNLVGVLTAAARDGRQAPSFETVRLSTDALALRGSVSEARLTELGARKVFDRTSLNLAVWLPLSEQAGGTPAIWPNSPPIPVPGVERLDLDTAEGSSDTSLVELEGREELEATYMDARTSLQPAVVTPKQASSIKPFGLDMDVLLTTEATGGATSVIVAWHKPGEGPPDHVHFKQEEILFIIEGLYEATVGGETAKVGPGSIVFIPRNVVHRFKNVGGTTGRMLGWSLPGGQDHYLKAISELAADGGFTGEKVIEISKTFDTHFPVEP